MKTVASPSDGDNRRRDRRRLERDFRYVISAFSSPCVGRPSARYVAALANIHSSLFAMACHFYRREPSRNRREGLAGNAVQEWYRNMQMKGFRALPHRSRRTTFHAVCHAFAAPHLRKSHASDFS